MPMRGAACSAMHWHTFFPYFAWAMWPRQLGVFGPGGPEKWEIMPTHWHCMQPRSLAYFPPTVLGHMAQTSRGKVCQCMALHAAPRIGILFHIRCWATWPRTVRQNSARRAAACSPMHVHTYALLVSRPCVTFPVTRGPEK